MNWRALILRFLLRRKRGEIGMALDTPRTEPADISVEHSTEHPKESLLSLQKSALLNLSDENQHTAGTGSDVLLGAIREIPGQTVKLAQEAWEDPGKFVLNSAKTLGESAAIGIAMGMLIPSRGIAAGVASLAFTAPMAIGTYRRVEGAYDAGNMAGANVKSLSKSLADDLVHEGWDFALGTAGAYGGATAGHRIATSDTAFGAFSQKAQRLSLKVENGAMLGLAAAPEFLGKLIARPTVNSVDLGANALASETAAASNTTPKPAWFLPKDSALSTRLIQSQAEAKEYTIRMGSLHGHSYYSDGMGTPAEIFAKAKAEGMDFYAITDHNHLAARTGVGPDDPRAADQAKVPIIASMPSEYTATLADAAAATEPGKFVAIVGVEMGTIGHVAGDKGGGHGGGIAVAENRASEAASLSADAASAAHHSRGEAHSHKLPEEFAHMDVPENLPAPTVMRRIFEPDGTVIEHTHTLPQEAAAQAYREKMFLNARQASQAFAAENPVKLSPREQALKDSDARDAGHYSGINHVNVFEFPQMIIADRAGDGGNKAAGAIHYNDGDFNGLIKQIGNSPDTTGGLPVWQLNHPRYVADNNPNTPENLRGRDYGTKSFPNIEAWRAAMDPRVHQVEIITGEALNPDPIEVMKPHDLGPINMAGYVDYGLHVSPSYGRDDHFALPGGRPAGTGILAENLDTASLLNALRNRQTIATTSTELLKGHMTANNLPMGSIIDEHAVNDLNITMNIDGRVEAKAQYKVNLWADPKIGDGQLAKMIQSKSLTGQDILNANGQVQLDTVQHTIGNKSAWYVEVQRVDPKSSNTDYMWTAPVWIEPQIAGGHSLLTRALIGAGSSYIANASN